VRIFSLIVAGLSLATAFPAQHAAVAAAPVTINQCFVTQPKPLSKNAGGTQIVWTNTGSRALSSVTFAVGYRNAEHSFIRRVTDTGSFSPGATLDHHFALYNDVVYAGKATKSCSVVAYR
jgi:hypothetical protein